MPSIPLLDSLIYVGIILLILSQITEKITTFIRTYVKVISTSHRKGKKKKKRKTIFGKTIDYILSTLVLLDSVSDLEKSRIKEVSIDEKPQIEFAITKLSILIGFLIAFSFKASLLELIGSNQLPHTLLGWQGYHFCFDYPKCWVEFSKIIFGCSVTGFLLAFGSKFFHDLLETLYEVKRLRGKLADEYTYRSPNMETLEQRIQSKFDDPVKVVLEKHKELLMQQFSNIIMVARVFDNVGNSYLEISTEDANNAKIKQYDFGYNEGGEIKKLPPNRIFFVLNVGKVEPFAGNKLYVGNYILNLATPNNMGTLGFFIPKSINNPAFFVTCYHVLRTEQHGWTELGNVDPTFNNVYGILDGETDFSKIGVMVKGAINESLDAVIVRLNDELQFSNEDEKWGTFTIAPEAQLQDNQVVKVNGATSVPMTGVIHSIDNRVKVNYSSPQYLNHLICLKNPFGTQALSQGGDSGAIVLNDNNKVIGIVLGGNGVLTYAIPISRVMNFINEQ